MPKTSESHPLRIDIVDAAPTTGRIGLTFCPGKVQSERIPKEWERDLDLDLQRIVDSGASALVSLIEGHEYERLKVTALPERAKAFGLQWWGMPVPDGGVPGRDAEDYYAAVLGPELHRRLRAGELIVIHCKGGLGRAGSLAARLLVELGQDPDEAMHKVRQARPGAIENRLQERFVRACATRPAVLNDTSDDGQR